MELLWCAIAFLVEGGGRQFPRRWIIPIPLIHARDGTIKVARLKHDLSEIVGEARLLFKASDASWTPRGRDRYVTDAGRESKESVQSEAPERQGACLVKLIQSVERQVWIEQAASCSISGVLRPGHSLELF